MADCSGLENRQRGNTFEGSNPSSSAEAVELVETPILGGSLSINDEATRGDPGGSGKGSGDLLGGGRGMREATFWWYSLQTV